MRLPEEIIHLSSIKFYGAWILLPTCAMLYGYISSSLLPSYISCNTIYEGYSKTRGSIRAVPLNYGIGMRPAPINTHRQHHWPESVLLSDHDRIDDVSAPESLGTARVDWSLLEAPRSSDRARRKGFQNFDGTGKSSMFTIWPGDALSIAPAHASREIRIFSRVFVCELNT